MGGKRELRRCVSLMDDKQATNEKLLAPNHVTAFCPITIRVQTCSDDDEDDEENGQPKRWDRKRVTRTPGQKRDPEKKSHGMKLVAGVGQKMTGERANPCHTLLASGDGDGQSLQSQSPPRHLQFHGEGRDKTFQHQSPPQHLQFPGEGRDQTFQHQSSPQHLQFPGEGRDQTFQHQSPPRHLQFPGEGRDQTFQHQSSPQHLQFPGEGGEMTLQPHSSPQYLQVPGEGTEKVQTFQHQSPPRLLQVPQPDPKSDLAALKATATRLKLRTRSSSFMAWQSQWLDRSRAPPHLPVGGEGEGRGGGGEGGGGGKEENGSKLTAERKERINQALHWLTAELKEMQHMDQDLARQLLSLRHELHVLRLSRSCEEHRALLDDAQCDLQEQGELGDLLELPAACLTHTPQLQHLGVTRMNLSSRRFSTC